jgi:hypothetical protein
LAHRASRRSLLYTLACLCLPFVSTACSTSGSPALFHLGGKGTLIIGHYSIVPRYRYLALHWHYSCSGPSRRLGFGVRVNAFRGGDPAKNSTARSVLSDIFVVPGSQGKADVAGESRIAIHGANYIVVSVGAAMGRTTFYDLNTRCAFQITATGETG